MRSSLTLQGTTEDFIAQGGTNGFKIKLWSSLDISAKEIQIVNIKHGSIIVTYDLVVKDGGKTLEELKTIQTKMLATAGVKVGLPILEATAGEEKIITDGVVVADGYDSIIITTTPTNTPEGDSGVATPPRMYGSLTQMQFFAIVIAGGLIVISAFIFLCTWALCKKKADSESYVPRIHNISKKKAYSESQDFSTLKAKAY